MNRSPVRAARLSTHSAALILLMLLMTGGVHAGADGQPRAAAKVKAKEVPPSIVLPNPPPTRPPSPHVGGIIEQKLDKTPFRIRLKLASAALDEWTKRIEEYGSVTMSSPLISRENEAFKFEVSDGPQAFYDTAKTRVDGTAAATLAIINKLSISGEAAFDPLAKAQFNTSLANFNNSQQAYNAQLQGNNAAILAQQQAAKIKLESDLQKAADPANAATSADLRAKAYNDYAAAMKTAGPLTQPQFPDPSLPAGGADAADGAGKPAGSPAAQALANLSAPSTEETAFLNLIGGITTGTAPAAVTAPSRVSDRVALIEAAGNTSVKAIFQLLGQPDKAIGFEDKRVLFATVTVGVNPGWRTRRDFAAEITSQASYRYTRARSDVVLSMHDRLPDEVKAELLQNHRMTSAVAELEREKEMAAPQEVRDARKAFREAQAAAEKVAGELRKAEGKQAQVREKLQTVLEAIRDNAKDMNGKEGKLKEIYELSRKNRRDAIPRAPNADAIDNDTQIGKEAESEARKAIETLTRTLKAVETMNEELGKEDVEIGEAAINDVTSHLPAVTNPPQTGPNQTLSRQVKRLGEDKVTAEKLALSFKNEKPKIVKLAKVRDDTAKTSATTEAASEKATRDSGWADPSSSGLGNGTAGKLLLKKDWYFDHPKLKRAAPLVAGISPLMETQVLDLKDAYGRQDQIAIALAVTLRNAGQKGSAQLFDRFIRQQTKAAATRSSLPVVNTFSASGGLFGFQVGPRLRALEDPASRKGGSANVLDRQSFPAVLIIGVDRADLSPVICRDYDGMLYVFEPQLVLRQTSRWNPLDGKLFTPFKDPWWNPLSWGNPRYSERDRADNLMNVADQFKELDKWLRDERRWLTWEVNKPQHDGAIPSEEFHEYAHVVQSLSDRRDALAALCTGSESTQYLPLDVLNPKAAPTPPPAMPQIVRVVPDAVSAQFAAAGAAPDPSQTQTFILFTEGMQKAAAPAASLIPPSAGSVLRTDNQTPGALVVTVLLTKTMPAAAFKVDMTLTSNVPGQKAVPASIVSPPFTIKAIPAANAAAQAAEALFIPALKATIKRDAAGLATDYEFRLNPDLSEKAKGLEQIILRDGTLLHDLKPSEMKLKAAPDGK